MKSRSWAPFGLLLLLYVLHNDWWQWSDARLVAGLPVGLTYHIAYMAVTSVAMFLLVRLAWPSHLEVEGDVDGPAPSLGDDGEAGR